MKLILHEIYAVCKVIKNRQFLNFLFEIDIIEKPIKFLFIGTM